MESDATEFLAMLEARELRLTEGRACLAAFRYVYGEVEEFGPVLDAINELLER